MTPVRQNTPYFRAVCQILDFQIERTAINNSEDMTTEKI